jgi:hypothetical protein
MPFLLALLVAIIVLGLVFGIVMWGIRAIDMPAPFKNAAIAVACLLMVILLLGLLFGGIPMPWYQPTIIHR